MGFKNLDTTELKSQPGLYESGTVFPLDKLSDHVTLDLLVTFVRPQALCVLHQLSWSSTSAAAPLPWNGTFFKGTLVQRLWVHARSWTSVDFLLFLGHLLCKEKQQGLFYSAVVKPTTVGKKDPVPVPLMLRTKCWTFPHLSGGYAGIKQPPV